MSKKDLKKIDFAKSKDERSEEKIKEKDEELKNLKNELIALKEQVQKISQAQKVISVKLEELTATSEREHKEFGAPAVSPEEIVQLHEFISSSSKSHEHLKNQVEGILAQIAHLEQPKEVPASFFDELQKNYEELKARLNEISTHVSGKSEETSASLLERFDQKYEQLKEEVDKLLIQIADLKGIREAPPSEEIIEDRINKIVDELVETRIKSLEERVAKTVGSELTQLDDILSTIEQIKSVNEEHKREYAILNQKIDSMIATRESIKETSGEAPADTGVKHLEATAKLIQFIEEKVGALPSPETTETFIKKQLEQAEQSDLSFTMESLLDVMINYKASVLQLRKDSAPLVKVEGELIPVGDKILTEADCAKLLLPMLTPEQQRVLAYKEDLSLTRVHERTTFKFIIFIQRKSIGATIKMLPTGIPTFSSLLLPEDFKTLFHYKNGLILVSGLHGSGRSSIAAAIIDFFNSTEKLHIITLENPIEFNHPNDKLCLVTQRELGTDFFAFGPALRQSLNQDPDVIFIGELNDAETLMNALVAADTGHLVISTIISPDVVSTIEKIIDTYPGDGRKYIQRLLARVLRVIIGTKLIETQTQGKVSIVEVLVNTPEIAGLIEDNRLGEIYRYMEKETEKGMRTFIQSLSRLADNNTITMEEFEKYQRLFGIQPAKV